MRRFTDLEKKYIQKLCNDAKPGKFYIAANIFYNLFFGRVAYIINSKKLIIYCKEGKDTLDEIKNITDEVIEVAFLLDYLEKEGLIYYIEDNNNSLPDICVLTKKILQESKLIEVPRKIDPKTESVLKKTMTYRVIAGQTLRDFVDNGFKTVEDLQLDEARAQSKIAIKSLEEARIQSKKAIESLDEARIQSETAIESLKEAKKNTRIAWLAVIVALTMPILISQCTTQSVRVEEVKSPIIQTIKKEILPKQEIEKKVLPVAQPEKSYNAKMISGDKMKKK